MALREDRYDLRLTPEGIDACSVEIAIALNGLGIDRRSVVRIRLTLEEALLSLIEHFDEDTVATVIVGSSLSSSFVRVEVEGEPYNPLGFTNNDDWMSSMFSSLGLRPSYAYVGGRNHLRITLPRVAINPALALLVGIGVGVLAGLLGIVLIPHSTTDGVVNSVLSPLLDLWARLLNAIAAPVIFVTVLTTVLNMREIELHGGDHRRMVARYFALNFALGFVAVIIASLRFVTIAESDFFGMGRLSHLLSNFSSILPEHILEPFITSNTAQLMLMAFTIGAAMNALGERVGNLARIVRQVNLVSSLVTKWASVLVPFLSAVMLAMEIWEGKYVILLQIWRPLVLSVIISMTFLLVDLLVFCRRRGVDVSLFVRKVLPPFLTTVRSGTLDASYSEAEHSCVYELGMDQGFVDATLPQGLVLFMPASIMGTLVFTVFDAHVCGVQTTTLWFVMAVILDVVLFVATPPVPGANLLAFIALFQILGIPNAAFLDAMIFDIVFGLLANAANQTWLQMEMVTQADRMGLLDRQRLCK